MSRNSAIEWTDATFNPWWGCTKVSPACDHCYAERDAKRFAAGRVLWGVGAERREFGEKHWKQPKVWAKSLPKELGRRPRVFCASMADVFDKDAPAGARTRLFRLIEETPELDWLLLTKRIGNASEMMFRARGGHLPLLPNVWLGATVVNQEEADRDIPKLLAVPAAVRFLSIEPMLGPIDLCELPAPDGSGRTWDALSPCGPYRIDWVIAGGESGPHARPAHPDWFRSLRDQCASAGVPFHFKQWGEWAPRGPESLGYSVVEGVPRIRLTDTGDNGSKLGAAGGNDCWMNRAGKRTTGRLLDGVAHDGFPA